MALSNWDTFALNLDGPCDGTITSALGISVEVYKNWLYVRDSQSAREGGHFDASTSTVMQIESGYVVYHDVDINAMRGPQDGVFVFVKTGKQMMAGCGVYGWDAGDRLAEPITDSEGFRRYVPPPWLGVTQESRDFLRRHVSDFVSNEHPLMSTQLWEEGLRFNQGDAYLSRHLDLGVPATPIGDQESPVATRIFGEAEQ